MSDDFTVSKHGDICAIKVILVRALMKDTQEFTQLLSTIINDHYLKLIIDLSFCEFVDSTFIGAMVVASKVVAANEGEIKVIIPKENVLKIFQSMGLFKIFQVSGNLQDALNSF